MIFNKYKALNKLKSNKQIKNSKIKVFNKRNKNLIFHNNQITLLNNNDKYEIVNYQYNDLINNELISINNILFQVIGLNYFTGVLLN